MKQTAPGLYITEDTSRRVREQRAELLRFSREIRKRHPEKVIFSYMGTLLMGPDKQ